MPRKKTGEGTPLLPKAKAAPKSKAAPKPDFFQHVNSLPTTKLSVARLRNKDDRFFKKQITIPVEPGKKFSKTHLSKPMGEAYLRKAKHPFTGVKVYTLTQSTPGGKGATRDITGHRVVGIPKK